MRNELIAYYIEKMASKEFVKALFNKYGISCRENSYAGLKNGYLNSGVEIPIDEFTAMCREWWRPSPVEWHISNLSSGVLAGHSWHRARPSMLHYSLQEKVRECISAKNPVEELIEIGRDIMKHEYFMVATHDVCESLIIESFPDCIPPTRSKSISDFIFRGVPYDIKVSTYPAGFSQCRTPEERVVLAQALSGGADTLRIRREAADAFNGWGDNRMYVVVGDQQRWLDDTEALVEDIMSQVSSLGEPANICIGNESILVQIVEV